SEINVTKNTTLKIKVKDNAGNESEVFTYNYVTTSVENPKENIAKDTTAPTFTLIKTPAAEWSNTNVLITINATDDLSGVKEYSFDDGVTWQTGNTKEFSQTTNIKVKVKDNEENISTAKELSIKIDKIEPVIIGIKNEEIYTKEVTFTIIEDNIATQVLKKDGTEIDFVNTVSEEGSYSIIITDKAGNIATVIFEIILSDNNLVIGSPLDWVVSEEMNSTGGYTLLEFKGDMENSTSIEVEEDYYNNDNISIMYLLFMEIEDTEEMPNRNAYTINIPTEVDGKIITEIGKGIFTGIDPYILVDDKPLINEPNMRIKSVNIANGIKKIGYISSNEEEMYEKASFSFALNLSFITLPDTLFEIGDTSFINTNITNLVLPKSITNLGYSCFEGNLVSSLIFEGAEDETSQLKIIGENAFAYNEIFSLIIPSSVEEINNNSFQANAITSLTFKGYDTNSSKLLTIGKDAFSSNHIKTLFIPSSVREISDNAFGFNSITSLTFMGAEDETSNLKIIGGHAFGQNNISEVIIPAGIETINEGIFYGSSLTSLTFAGTSTDGSGNDTSNLNKIASYAFDVSDIDHIIYLPSSITSVLLNAFQCDYRESTCTFYLNQLELPINFSTGDHRIYILDGNGGYKCVKNCPLPEWEVSEEMNSTGGYTLLRFNGDLENSNNVIVEEDYYDDANISPIYLSLTELYSTDEMINKNAYTINIPSVVEGKTITEIGPNIFSGMDFSKTIQGEHPLIESNMRIKDVNIPEGIKKIDTIANSYVEIPYTGSFVYAVNLRTVVLPSTLIEIGDSSFNMTYLTGDIVIPKSVVKVGHAAFMHLNNISNIIFEGAEDGTSQLKYIGNVAFAAAFEPNISTLDVIIPASVEYIMGWAFANNNVTSITFLGAEDGTSQLKEIGEAGFQDNSIESLLFPTSLEVIRTKAFYKNPLNSFTIAGTSIDGSGNDTSSLWGIYEDAFTDAELDSKIYLPSSLTYLGSTIFNCNYKDSNCTFYINQEEIPSYFYNAWEGQKATIYILDGIGGYKCVKNCPVPDWDVSETLNSTGG
ncbi:MAG: leucine-rich repeat protein, partial [Tenericutes bacterium]|nr:leucine-rich repeat protein [Mycoplasmatota bacterium]